jgi:hypothetical protein
MELIKKKILVLMMMKSIYVAEEDDEEYNVEQPSTLRLTTNGKTIPEDNCRVVIESL